MNSLAGKKSWLLWAAKIFVWSIFSILLMSLMLKLVTLVFAWGQLTVRDPLFSFLSTRQILSLVVGYELGMLVFLLFSRDQVHRSLSGILWMAFVFAGYRFGLLAIGHEGGCLCAGKPETFLNLAQANSLKWIMEAVFYYMLFVGLLMFMLNMRMERSHASARPQSG